MLFGPDRQTGRRETDDQTLSNTLAAIFEQIDRQVLSNHNGLSQIRHPLVKSFVDPERALNREILNLLEAMADALIASPNDGEYQQEIINTGARAESILLDSSRDRQKMAAALTAAKTVIAEMQNRSDVFQEAFRRGNLALPSPPEGFLVYPVATLAASSHDAALACLEAAKGQLLRLKERTPGGAEAIEAVSRRIRNWLQTNPPATTSPPAPRSPKEPDRS